MQGSIRDGLHWVGDGMEGKVYSTKWCYGMGEAQEPAWKGCAGFLMAEMKHNLQCGCSDC